MFFSLLTNTDESPYMGKGRGAKHIEKIKIRALTIHIIQIK